MNQVRRASKLRLDPSISTCVGSFSYSEKQPFARFYRALFRAGCLSLLGVGLFFAAPAARADSLTDALVRTYQANPALQAERARLRSTDEKVPQALAGMRPSVNVLTTTQRSKLTDSLHNSSGVSDRKISLEVTQPLYRGGRIQAGVAGAHNKVLAERAQLLSTEQAALLAAATAYMDVTRDKMTLELIANYQKALEKQVQIERRRLIIGENTKTDISQAEARLAESVAERIQAEATLRASSSDYLRVTGIEPGSLAPPKFSLELPGGLDEVVDAARANNPDILVARYTELSARNDVEAADGELLPAVDAVGSVYRRWSASSTEGRADGTQIVLQMTLPIDNGAISSRARAARQTVSEMMLQIENVQRTVIDKVTKSWSNMMAQRAQVKAREAMIKSVNETLKSLRAEVNIGTRTVTDLLNAEQEALSARVGLINVKHDEVVSSFTLLQGVGRLTAQAIRLPVDYYDYEQHYERVRGKVWGVSMGGDTK
ncbi:MAG: TolC family outer membrane protein [Rhodospirillaceae bacterium]